MESGASSASQRLESSPLNFIYACSICCATFADTYEGHNETVQGLSDGINPKDRLVTKLYLSGCCHVFCGEHIEGGGPSFHPAGQKPRAPCPFCVKEKGDATVRDLYSIRGFYKDEYDPAIPPIWFTAPPMSLDGPTKEMEALRFQYLALARYCQTSYRTRKTLTDALKNTKQELATVQNRAAEERSETISLQHENEKLRAAAEQAGEVDSLRAEVQRLQHLEQEKDQFEADLEAFRCLEADVRNLDTFRKNKAAILHYLKLFPKVAEQNTKMKERLSSLGFAMAVEPIPNYPQLTSDDLNEIEGIAEAYAEDDRRFQKSSSSHTAGRSAHTLGYPFTSSDRPLKRQRVDSPLPRDMHIDPPSSRDMMPPPSKPLSRMRSVRSLFPTIRKKFSSSRSSSKEHRNNNGDVQMYDNEQWRDAADSSTGDDRSLPRRDLRSETPYMSGALPVEQASQRSHLLASVGAHGNASEFSFCASSPVKMNGGQCQRQSVQLPTGPSYLRLMDGLSRDNGIELGLKDPRENAPGHYEANNTVRPTVSTPQNQRQPQESNNQKRWGLGHAFLHQSPNGPPRQTNNQQLTSPLEESKGYFNRAHYDPFIRIATPGSVQLQQPARQTENVVSSFFGRSHYDALAPPQHRITETQTSSHRFAASQLRRYPTSQVSTEWREPRSLNGLSFIDLPLDSRNEPFMHNGHRQPSRHVSTQSYQDSCGFVTRADTHRSSFVDDSGDGSSLHVRPTFSRQQQLQAQSTMLPSSSFNQTLPSRIGQLPSSMPSVVSSHSPVRNRTQWETLQRAGVRSSRQMHGKIQGNMFNLSSTNPYSRVERRSVRR
ncbi:hypothetical protein BU25DRAFT_396799 [Macroventuria anomochaeta]|uniref:Uncharacterized protein n=1 Tax=Macroventuria anomochaeta TaxID=301207 RepID=A0ACB6RU14_9PLEO|nr:uncharacterized protein BU25DRAFT_396799 [Macroventuria anomochaeta]KAF2625490.1 hypothetical protein BU25DRAFT_396799 [Macroventuria anomochaeta]